MTNGVNLEGFIRLVGIRLDFFFSSKQSVQ